MLRMKTTTDPKKVTLMIRAGWEFKNATLSNGQYSYTLIREEKTKVGIPVVANQ